MQLLSRRDAQDFKLTAIFRRKKKRSRLGYFGLAILVTATVASGANPPQLAPAPNPPGTFSCSRI